MYAHDRMDPYHPSADCQSSLGSLGRLSRSWPVSGRPGQIACEISTKETTYADTDPLPACDGRAVGAQEIKVSAY